MINNWLRNNNIAAGIMMLLRIYLGYNFMIAGWGKITGGQFDASGFLNNAVQNPVKGPDGSNVFGLYHSFLENVALPNVEIFNILVPWGEFLVGIGLILGCLTTTAAFFGIIMNFSFLMAGAISHNPIDILIGLMILFAGSNAGKFGLDPFVIPFLKKSLFEEPKNNNGNGKGNVKTSVAQ
ncbi:DoxX family protein [Ureibacillus acetophenoni]|uniref:Thiosulfate dehydrogenase [quinone] large subunit n=1 Tax=Ureibacillus acetophenoni TaxID=614649 RepID=A0A285U2K7_9BACL|nr:DoxX family protein [Ureibacillus acetophenoni]SOC36164.1 thiosulfate dehydrogenase [quinone] large subunit [Ureibacillus acetophenoni]